MLVEVCANSLQSAINAEKAGADRIELCMELGVGGVTPSYGLLKKVKEHISIPIHVLIRPRSGDFTYSKMEFSCMIQNIELCVELGFDGIVSGVLTTDFKVDTLRVQELIKASKGLKFTFHRAFDWIDSPHEALEQLDALGVDYILTSGQQKSAFKGLGLLKELQDLNTACTIMPGSGINAKNALYFKNAGFSCIHLSGVKQEIRVVETPKTGMITPLFLHDFSIIHTDDTIIKSVVEIVK